MNISVLSLCIIFQTNQVNFISTIPGGGLMEILDTVRRSGYESNTGEA